MPKFQKYVNALFLAGSALIWLVGSHYTETVISYFQLARKIGTGADVLRHGLPIVLGILTFTLLRRSVTANNFSTDAVAELIRVSWPSQKDVQLGTVVVIVTVIACGIFFGMVDLGFTHLVRVIIGA